MSADQFTLPTIILLYRRVLARRPYKRRVDMDPSNILDIPKHKYNDVQLCLYAIKKNPQNLLFIPKRFRTHDICLLAAKIGYNGILDKIPSHVLTYEMCRLLVMGKCSNSICDIPKHLLSYELCLYGVEKRGNTLIYVPDKYLSLEICSLAVINFPNIVNYMRSFCHESSWIHSCALSACRNNNYDKLYEIRCLYTTYRRKQFNAFLLGTISRGKSSVGMLYLDVMTIIAASVAK